MITRRAKYAIKALLCLARRKDDGLTLAIDIAAETDAPLPFLAQILVDLRRQGIVASRKGPRGGHALARRPEQISLLDVLRATDGPVAPLACLSRTAHAPCEDCADEASCAVRAMLAGVYETTIRAFADMTLADGARLASKLPEKE